MQATITSAKLNSLYTKITAPISGRIGLRLVDSGNIVHTTDANGLAIITQLQPIRLSSASRKISFLQCSTKLRQGVKLRADSLTTVTEDEIGRRHPAHGGQPLIKPLAHRS